MKPKVAFVVQRSGKEINGGAELLCLQIAEHMSKYWDVEILTTCAFDYMTWSNHYTPGEEKVGDVTIRRFEVDFSRNVKKFDALSEQIVKKDFQVTKEECEEWIQLEGPISGTLLDFIQENKAEYSAFFFFTYSYATTYLGLQLVAEKAYLVPFAHDEWALQIPMWDDFFALPKSILFSTESERALLQRRFPELTLPGELVGCGIDIPAFPDPNTILESFAIQNPYMLYIGRIDESKGCKELFDYFVKYKKETNNNLQLVLIGKAVMDVPNHPDIVSLGFVDDETKFAVLSKAAFLVNPSPHESLSLVLLEAWALAVPTLVTDKCDVLVSQTKRSNCGLWWGTFDEFILATNYLIEHREIALQGPKFIEKNYEWSVIEQKYLALLS